MPKTRKLKRKAKPKNEWEEWEATSELTYSCDLCGAPISEYTYFHNRELCHKCSWSH